MQQHPHNSPLFTSYTHIGSAQAYKGRSHHLARHRRVRSHHLAFYYFHPQGATRTQREASLCLTDMRLCQLAARLAMALWVATW